MAEVRLCGGLWKGHFGIPPAPPAYRIPRRSGTVPARSTRGGCEHALLHPRGEASPGLHPWGLPLQCLISRGPTMCGACATDPQAAVGSMVSFAQCPGGDQHNGREVLCSLWLQQEHDRIGGCHSLKCSATTRRDSSVMGHFDLEPTVDFESTLVLQGGDGHQSPMAHPPLRTNNAPELGTLCVVSWTGIPPQKLM